MNRFGNILSVICAAVLFLCSCSIDERIDLPEYSGQSGTELSFTGNPMSRYKVATKASDPKEEDEKRINQLYIFFFTQGGDYLEGTYLKGYPNAAAWKTGGYYAPGEGVVTLKIANNPAGDYFSSPEEAKHAVVYALANVDPDILGLNDLDEETGRPKSIRNMSDLESIFYSPYSSSLTDASPELEKQMLWNIPAEGMPMVGKKIVDLTSVGDAAGNEDERTIELKALMSRIDVNIRLETEEYEPGLPRLTMVEWTTLNMPKGAVLGESSAYTDLSGDRKISSVTREQYRQITNNNGEISLSFYMFENVQDPEAYDYPADVKEEERQRYKPKLANENATAIRLHCNYATYNDKGGNATYDVNYTLYLGADHTDDFTIRRNHQYKNDIVIKGLIHHDDVSADEAYSFDARVNIDHDNNKYHIAILRERNHDAHFCVTPMDIYLFADPSLNPQLTVTIDEDSRRWIGMELITAEDMSKGTVDISGFTAYTVEGSGTHIATGTPFTAGNGKRAFFTTSLFPKSGDIVDMSQSPLKNTITSTTNRDRIYFYLDENLKLENRTAIVTLTYQDIETPPESRTLLLEQVHLIPVVVYNRNDDNEWTNERHTIYMEQFEEYLQHYDPLDLSNTEQMYAGLKWIEDGEYYATNEMRALHTEWSCIRAVCDPHKVYYEGLQYTDYMIQLTDHQIMFLNGVPSSAFEYCYNKNQRSDGGIIPTSLDEREVILGVGGWYEKGEYSLKWFLPGIRQMEDALKQKYTQYREFQEELYWSSAAGAIDNFWGNAQQDATHARATGVDADGEYIHSNGSEENPLGYKLRTDVCRIRAFRIDLEPYDY